MPTTVHKRPHPYGHERRVKPDPKPAPEPVVVRDVPEFSDAYWDEIFALTYVEATV